MSNFAQPHHRINVCIDVQPICIRMAWGLGMERQEVQALWRQVQGAAQPDVGLIFAQESDEERDKPGQSLLAAGLSPCLCLLRKLDAQSLAWCRRLLQQREHPSLWIWVQEAGGECYASIQALLSEGAQDVLIGWPLQKALAHLASTLQRQAQVAQVMQSSLLRDHLAGQDGHWQRFLNELVHFSLHQRSAVLLQGETGTGKELLARLIHTLDPRPQKGDLIVVDCTALNGELAGSELFGHERGSFTGAHASRKGAAAQADGGTLFLDEIGELHPVVQAQLLRLLQEGCYKSVGSERWQKADFRLVSASHRDLWQLVQEGRFRADLYFRLCGYKACVPALRERGQDAIYLAKRFLAEFGCAGGCDVLVEHLLAAYDFPGNVRELRQIMQYSAQRAARDGAVSIGALPQAWAMQVLRKLAPAYTAALSPGNEPQPTITVPSEQIVADWVQNGLGLREITQKAGDLAISAALQLETQHVGRAAKRLGITERAIQLRKAARVSA